MIRLEKAIKNYYNDPNFCKNCGIMIEHEKPCEAKRMKFCNRSCAAIYNNKKYPKRISKYKDKRKILFIGNGEYKIECHICGESKHPYSKNCQACKKALSVERQYQTLVKDSVYDNGNARVKYSHIRRLARRFLDLWEIPQVCGKCGYDKIVHACHLKPISDFEENGRMIDVNGPVNLMYLCPNHHWELDNNLLEI